MKKLIKKIFNVLSYVVIGFLFLCVGLALYGKKTNRQVFNYSFMWVMTESMEPSIQEKSYILVTKVDTDDLEEGDIITFISQDPAIKGSLNTHRIIEVIGNNEQFKTKGDNNPTEDQYLVDADDVYGKYVCNLKILTYFGRIYSTELGLTFTILLIGGLGALTVVPLFKEMKEDARKERIEKLVQAEVARLEKEGLKSKEEDEKGE